MPSGLIFPLYLFVQEIGHKRRVHQPLDFGNYFFCIFLFFLVCFSFLAFLYVLCMFCLSFFNFLVYVVNFLVVYFEGFLTLGLAYGYS